METGANSGEGRRSLRGWVQAAGRGGRDGRGRGRRLWRGEKPRDVQHWGNERHGEALGKKSDGAAGLVRPVRHDLGVRVPGGTNGVAAVEPGVRGGRLDGADERKNEEREQTGEHAQRRGGQTGWLVAGKHQAGVGMEGSRSVKGTCAPRLQTGRWHCSRVCGIVRAWSKGHMFEVRVSCPCQSPVRSRNRKRQCSNYSAKTKDEDKRHSRAGGPEPHTK